MRLARASHANSAMPTSLHLGGGCKAESEGAGCEVVILGLGYELWGVGYERRATPGGLDAGIKVLS